MISMTRPFGTYHIMKTSPLTAKPMKPTTIQNKINHVTLVLDTSASMRGQEKSVIKATDDLMAFLAKRSQEMDQETRITVYLFDTDSTCVIYDKDVLRMPSLRDLYTADGHSTNLLGASIKALEEAGDVPERYGDHAFLFYILTDGGENAGRHSRSELTAKIERAPENYTLAILVPGQSELNYAAQAGFPRDNIAIWDTSKSVEEAGKTILKATETFYQARSTGVRSMSNLFAMDLGGLNSRKVQANLTPLRRNEYKIYPVKKKSPISQFVAFYEGIYRTGMAFYELMKPEIVQANKAVAIMDKATNDVFVGSAARQMLGLPDYNIKVQPDSHPRYKVFVQSTSVNRNLIGGTELLVMKNAWL